MSFVTLCQLAAFCAVIAYRIALSFLPFFQGMGGFYRSWSVGLLSDLALFLVAFGVLEVLKPIEQKRFGFLVKIPAALVALFFLIGLPAHLRYMQHFGVTFHPMHLLLGNTGNAVGEGIAIALDSPLTLASFFGPVIILGIWTWFTMRRRRPLSNRRWLVNSLIAMAVALLFNSLTMSLRNKPHMDRELIYNPLTAFFMKSKALAASSQSLSAQTDIRSYLRQEFGAHRSWSDESILYPLWQERVATDKPLTAEHERIRRELKEFIAREEKEKGPWNVLVVLLESFRIDGVEGFEPKGKYMEGITPAMTKSFKEAVRFTEMMTTGDMTQLGQVAALCSVYSTPEMSVMPHAPYSNLACLPDIFAHAQYETYFFCGTDNNFDNQNKFYPFHKTKHVLGVEDFPNRPKGNWGISDHAMFTEAAHRLADGPQPFFATILSLSSHSPFRLPEDAPDFIDRKQAPREQVRQYVDWAWGGMMEIIKEKASHTIVVLAADHGVHHQGEAIPRTSVPFDLMRTQYRIPLAFIIPGMPEPIAGSALDNIISLVDLPPTLLNLLGLEETKQQFMGHDAFSRREPVLINWAWLWRWLRFDEHGKNPRLDAEEIPQNRYAYWRTLQSENRFAPKPQTQYRPGP